MNLATYPLAASMVNQLNRVDAISNNLANMKTAGFKQEQLVEGSFNQYLKKAQEAKEPINEMTKIINTTPKIESKYIDGTIGNIVTTANGLDFAITKRDLYFKVKSADGEVYLTRDGSFSNQNGILTTKSGLQVLNANGEPVAIDNENNFATTIGLFKTDLVNIEKIGSNNYKIIDNNKVEVSVTDERTLTQGAYEQSNVNSLTSMIALIEAQRAFEQAQKAITGLGDLSSTLIEKIGNVK